MIQNPFLPSPSAANAWSEGFIKAFTAISSPQPGENIGIDDVEAFNQGVTAGASSQQSGLPLNNPCIPALEEHSPLHGAGVTINAAEIAHGAWEAAHLAKLAAGVASIVVALIELACTLPVHMRPPEEVLPDLGQPMIDALASFGLDSMEIFCGAGLDINATDCEILLSPLFTSQDQARQAAVTMGRPAWVVVRWRTDQSNSFRVVDSGPDEA